MLLKNLYVELLGIERGVIIKNELQPILELLLCQQPEHQCSHNYRLPILFLKIQQTVGSGNTNKTPTYFTRKKVQDRQEGGKTSDTFTFLAVCTISLSNFTSGQVPHQLRLGTGLRAVNTVGREGKAYHQQFLSTRKHTFKQLIHSKIIKSPKRLAKYRQSH